VTDTPDDIVEEQAADEAEMRDMLSKLKEDHRHIDNEIKALEETGVVDVLKIRRLKKIKLSIKDKVVYLENQLTPDIIA